MDKVFFIISLLGFNIAFGQSDYIERALDKAREKKFDEAILLTDSVIAIDSNSSDLFMIKAEFLWMSNNYYDAAIVYQKAMALDNNFLHGAYLMLGVLYEKAGLRTHAQLQYLKAIYFFETKKRKDDKFFLDLNKMDYVTAIILSGNDKEIKKIYDDLSYKNYLEPYIGKSRSAVLEIFFKPFMGD